MTLRADEQGRLGCVDLFAPNALFDVQKQNDGSVRVQRLANNDIPTIEPVFTEEGFLIIPATIDGKKIAAAIRADRDDQ